MIVMKVYRAMKAGGMYPWRKSAPVARYSLPGQNGKPTGRRSAIFFRKPLAGLHVWGAVPAGTGQYIEEGTGCSRKEGTIQIRAREECSNRLQRTFFSVNKEVQPARRITCSSSLESFQHYYCFSCLLLAAMVMGRPAAVRRRHVLRRVQTSSSTSSRTAMPQTRSGQWSR